MRKSGRPRGSASRCGFCGEFGHNARAGSCAGGRLAEELVRRGWSVRDAADHVGVTPRAVCIRLKRRPIGAPILDPRPAIEEHW